MEAFPGCRVWGFESKDFFQTVFLGVGVGALKLSSRVGVSPEAPDSAEPRHPKP